MAGRRRAIPILLVAVTSVMAIAAAVLGFRSSPSSEQLDLQVAAQRTAEAGNFRFTFATQFSSPNSRLPTFSILGHGTWQFPDRWQFRTEQSHQTSVTTGSGSTFRVSGDGPTLTFRLPTTAFDSFNDPSGPVVSLPPLGLLLSATNVSRRGDIYSFDVPSLDLAAGWVAYAPLSGTSLPLPLVHVVNSQVRAVIKHGYVASISFPRGLITAGGKEMVTARWSIFDVGDV